MPGILQLLFKAGQRSSVLKIMSPNKLGGGGRGLKKQLSLSHPFQGRTLHLLATGAAFLSLSLMTLVKPSDMIREEG